MSNAETLVGEWLPFPDVAQMLDVTVTKVHGLVDEGALVALRVGDRGIRKIPAAFLNDGVILDSLKGTVAVLRDAGYNDEDMLVWLFTEDESLPGRPIDALIEGRKTEIRRRAQSLAW
ncbi:Rv2175c family DNA-binding protein [Pseudarthrobacter sp. J1738]|uniref:Rv2175c family DNA-binding protein n=1 Tax=unclassified Pseudarthrobacter TaxID=2647000 RepID=UPI003D26EB36